jgi:hypothetical protein
VALIVASRPISHDDALLIFSHTGRKSPPFLFLASQQEDSARGKKGNASSQSRLTLYKSTLNRTRFQLRYREGDTGSNDRLTKLLDSAVFLSTGHLRDVGHKQTERPDILLFFSQLTTFGGNKKQKEKHLLIRTSHLAKKTGRFCGLK